MIKQVSRFGNLINGIGLSRLRRNFIALNLSVAISIYRLKHFSVYDKFQIFRVCSFSPDVNVA